VRGKTRGSRDPYRAFTRAVQRAETSHALNLSIAATGAAQQDGRVALALLERKQAQAAPVSGTGAVITDMRGPSRWGDRWELHWHENGKKQTRTSPDRAALVAIRDKLLGGAVNAPMTLRKHGGFAARTFIALLRDTLEANRIATNARDWDGMKATRGRIASIREAAQAAMPFLGYMELEARLDAILDYLENHGHLVRIEGASQLQPHDTALAAALHSTVGPWGADDGSGAEVPDQGWPARGEDN